MSRQPGVGYLLGPQPTTGWGLPNRFEKPWAARTETSPGQGWE
jgi:hypothetical protein